MVYLIFVVLAILQALIMRRLPKIWTIGKYKFYPTPCYSAWGIGWVITGVALMELITWGQWRLFFIIFTLCFPFIFWGMQGKTENENNSDLDNLIRLQEALHQITAGLNKIIWKF